MNGGSEPAGGQTEQARAAANVDKTPARQVLNVQHLFKRGLGGRNAPFIQNIQESRPIGPKAKSCSRSNFATRTCPRFVHCTQSSACIGENPVIPHTPASRNFPTAS